MMMLITTLSKKPASLEHETSPERNTNPIEYIQQIHCKYQNLLFLRRLLDKYKNHLWYWNNISLKWSHQNKLKLRMDVYDYTSTKNRICKSTIAKGRTGTQSVVITTKSSWYWNRTWQYYSGIFWNHTFNIRKFTTTTSYMIWIFHSYTILYV